MFQDHQGALSRPPSICLVAPIDNDLAIALVKAGWRVHVLATDRESVNDGSSMETGIRVTRLTDLTVPPAFTLDGPNTFDLLHQSDEVRFALAELHHNHHFDVILFMDGAGLAFRSIQAKNVGLDFADVALFVCGKEPGASRRHRQKQWLNQPEDLARDYCERYAFEHADGQFVAEPVRLVEIRKLGWNVRDDVGTLTRRCQSPTRQRGSAQTLAYASGSDQVVSARPPSVATAEPLVTVAVAYYNLALYLDEALASLAAQTYPALEVLVINDGSADPEAIKVFGDMQTRYPQFQFFDQANAGIGATRNRGLERARGEYFLPMDADNVARPDMIARLVHGLERNPSLTALTSYFLAFQESADLAAERFLYAYKPTGGPRLLGCLRNVYGDGNALFRRGALQAVGGFTTDRDSSWEDWELFVKLVNAGYAVNVLPEFLFYYRRRDAGFSRVTENYRNHQRVLRQYIEIENLPRAERLVLWNLLAGMHLRLEELEDDNKTLQVRLRSKRYQVMDRLGAALNHVPGLRPTMKWLWGRWNRDARVLN